MKLLIKELDKMERNYSVRRWRLNLLKNLGFKAISNDLKHR